MHCSRKRIYWLVVVLLVSTIITLIGTASYKGSAAGGVRFTKSQAALIKAQIMSEEDVVSLLGVPPGDYTTHPHAQLPIKVINGYAYCRDWISDDGCIMVMFDSGSPGPRGIVIRSWFWRLPDEGTLAGRCRGWLRWLEETLGL
jgi:hypothetical protein